MFLLSRNPKLIQWKLLYSLVVEWLLSWLLLSIWKAVISDKGFAVAFVKPPGHCGRTCAFLIHLINHYTSSFLLYAGRTSVTVSVLVADGASRTLIAERAFFVRESVSVFVCVSFTDSTTSSKSMRVFIFKMFDKI